MEHKLIQGGEIWLPFARSRIKALHASGQQYASQFFTMPDGATVHVRIVDGIEYIRIGGGIKFYLDSGVVGLNATSGPNRNLPGTLYETDNVAAYNAAFVLSGSTRWRRKPSKTGQISGHIRHAGGANFTGKVPVDGQNAESFMSTFMEDKTVSPPTWRLDTEDERVSQKKGVANDCPSSIFTGRCRLYVQSVYGRPLYVPTEAEDGIGSAARPYSFPFEAPGPSALPPTLKVTPYRHNAEDADEDVSQITITTSTGVHLDTATGKHWLINITPGTVQCFPLLSEKPMQRFRALLTAANTSLDQIDKDHLEAYILATCLPSHVGMIQFNYTDSTGYLADSTAYGWHWNWSGTCADIVSTRDVYHVWTAGGDMYKQQSTHRRLTMSYGPLGLTGIALSTIQPATDWCLSRVFYVVGVPNWSLGGVDKVNTYIFSTSNAFAFDNVTFYAFYDRDELVTCRVSMTIGTKSVEEVGTINSSAVTSGGQAGWVETLGTSPYLEVKFAVGSTQTPELPSGTERSCYHREVSNTQQGGWSSQVYYGIGQGDLIDPATGILWPYALGRYYSFTDVFNYSTWDWTYYTTTRTYYGVGIAMIPANDAEACYLKHVLYHEDIAKNVYVEHLTSVDVATSHWYRRYVKITQWTPIWSGNVVIGWEETPTITYFYTESETGTWGQGGGYSGVDYIPLGPNRVADQVVNVPPETVITEDVAKLTTKGSVLNVTIDLALIPTILVPAEESIGTPFPVESGTAVTGQVIIAPNTILPDGIVGAPTGIVKPAIVGWA